MAIGRSNGLGLSILAISIAIFVVPALSQTFYGSIVGAVSESTGAMIQGAAVVLTNNGTGERRTATAGADGGYRFMNLVPGNYRLDIEQRGFKRSTRDQIVVNVDAAVRADVIMELGDVTQSVQVQAEAPLLQTESTSLGQVVEGRSVQELPLNGRNVLNLVSLVPGVVPQGSAMTNLTGQNVFAAGNYQIGGGTANQSATYFDGVPVNISHGNLVALVPSQDAVSEFRVETNNNSAEYGRYTGGVINLASRSGTNELHGNAYEFLRNRALNAGTFFANSTGAGKPAFTQNQFGANIGGPIRKDKTFFFFGYEGYRQRQAQLFRYSVPTAEQGRGDFSDYRNASGAVIPIYDPLTQCGAYGNAACGSGTAQRSPFPGNIIPPARINPVARKLVDYPNWGAPNGPGDPFTHLFNFSKNVSTGGDNNQYNVRGDQNVSDKQRLLARYTRWQSAGLDVDVFGNGMLQANNEKWTATQAVLADTYSFSPTTILDIRLGVTRWVWNRIQGPQGLQLSQALGLPSYFDKIPALDGLDQQMNLLPQIQVSGLAVSFPGGFLADRDTTLSLAPTLIKIAGRHTLKFGSDMRRSYLNYYSNNQVGGTFSFDNRFTSQNSLNPGATGYSFASLLVGNPASGSVNTNPFTSAGLRYQAYYVSDTWQATKRLTLSLGLRWEIPGVFTERFDRLATFDATTVNPVVQAAGVVVNGQPANGAFVLVNSPAHPERGLTPEHWTLFAPRVGAAYQLTKKTVLRMGGGIFHIPANIAYTTGPAYSPINSFGNIMVSSIDNQVTALNTLSNPFPNGLLAPPGRDPKFQQVLLGGGLAAAIRNVPYGYTGQWNFTVQHQFPKDIALEAAYAGLRGIHLPLGNLQENYLPTQTILSLGSQLQQQVPNPFYGLVTNGTLSQPTVQRGQLLMPFPQYTGVTDKGGYVGNSIYHALQMKVEKRFSSGGMLLASYTFSKTISNVETITSWLDGVSGVQNWDNLRGERSLANFDARQRLTVGYVLDLPVGKGKKFLHGVNGFPDKLISGWGISGVSTFQEGFPLGFSASPNLTGFNTGLRPNVVAGCDASIGGSAQSRLGRWFNPACFSVPGAFTFGTESRTDPNLRGPGINNFDFAVSKKTAITERLKLEFRAETFNLFNRVRFGNPDLTATTSANSTFGRITSQANDPRLIQLALRLMF